MVEATLPTSFVVDDMEDDLTPQEGQEYGTQYSCANCDAEDNWLLGTIYRPRNKPTRWWMGLLSDGNAHYFCDDCKSVGINVRPCMPSGYRG